MNIYIILNSIIIFMIEYILLCRRIGVLLVVIKKNAASVTTYYNSSKIQSQSYLEFDYIHTKNINIYDIKRVSLYS